MNTNTTLTYVSTKQAIFEDLTLFKKKAWKITRCLGVPPKYNMDVDPQYSNDLGAGYGRVYTKTILSNPTIISICPGKVKMFPNFTKDNGDGAQLLQVLKQNSNSAILEKLAKEEETDSKWTGKLYSFEATTDEYAKYLNVLCRACAILMGVGNNKMPNTSVELKYFDYAYWQYRNSFIQVPSKEGLRTIWTDFWKAGNLQVSSAVTDTNYVHFFVNNQETSISEQIQTSTSAPPIIGTISSTLSQTTSALNYYIGSGLSDSSLKDDLTKVINEYTGGDASGWMSLAGNLLEGGQLVFPEMLSEATYNKDIRCSFDFISPYGDPLSIFLNCTVPAMHLMAFALPKQLSDNMYTYPFVCRVYQQGMFNSDLCIINNIELTRGGDDSSHWTIDGLSTSWNVTITVTPLYTNLMMTSSDHPFKFMKNEGLMEYLGNLCGLDLKVSQLSVKLELITAFMYTYFTDIPTSLGRKAGNMVYKFVAPVLKFFNWVSNDDY